MTRKTLEKISENPKLIEFCNKILAYNVILENEFSRNMFFVSLISADTLIDEESCKETIEIANFIISHISLFILNDDIKIQTIKYMKKAIKIAKRDEKEFFIKKCENIILKDN